jgi:hypothetical protein
MPKLVPTLEMMGGNNVALTIENVGAGPAYDLDFTFWLEPRDRCGGGSLT